MTEPTEPAEATLEGGHVTGAVRVGATVRRGTGPWTPAVHDLLGHLTAAGLDGVPRVHGFDDQGREILDFLDGTVIDVDREELTDGQLASFAAWLRRFHDAVATFRPGPRRWYFAAADVPPDGIVCHNDVAPYNAAFDGDRLVGVFDWDLAGPGLPVNDLAFLVWNAVPLFREVPGWDLDRVAERLRVVAAAYGSDLGPAALAAEALERMRTAGERIAAGQAAGDPGMLRLAEVGEPARTLARVEAAAARLVDLPR